MKKNHFTTHFARTLAIVGTHLQQAHIVLMGLPQAAPLVTHLAACGVRRWTWIKANDESEGNLQAYLQAQHGPALGLDVAIVSADRWQKRILAQHPTLIIAVGNAEMQRQALQVAQVSQIPALLITPPTVTHSSQVWCIFPKDVEDNAIKNNYQLSHFIPDSSFFIPHSTSMSWLSTAPLYAGLARAILLRDTPYARSDLAELWAANKRIFRFDANNPLKPTWLTLEEASQEAKHQSKGSMAKAISPVFQTPIAQRGKILIAGLGSLGSVAAMHLIPHVTAMVIADPDDVDAYNPVRQAYPIARIGQPKAQALQRGLLTAGAKGVIALEKALTDEAEINDLIKRQAINAALIVTGTTADFALARALRAANIPHVVGRCYPRARYWEAIVVDGQRGPAFSDIRGQVMLGPAAPPTPEQIAAYSDAGALEAEPATLIESGWAAIWMARLLVQLMAPPALRERWFLELLATEQTCLIGGVGVAMTEMGAAYGITGPGVVRGLGRGEIRISAPS